MPATRSPATPVVVRVSTAARMMDCSRSFVYKLIEQGRLGRVRLAGSSSVRIPIEDVYTYLGREVPDDLAS